MTEHATTLRYVKIPDIKLPSTSNRMVNLATVTMKPTVVFLYPRTGRPDEKALVGWDDIPGARGCTPQSCGFRDLYMEFCDEGIQVFGISTQATKVQQEFVNRVNLPFEILSDHDFGLTTTLNLPTFEFEGMRLIKRMAWFCDEGLIKQVFYPVFPPDKNAEQVLIWLRSEKLQMSQLPSTRIFSGAPWEKQIGYCRSIKRGRFTAVSGTVAIDEHGRVFEPGNAYAQTKRCFEIIQHSLRQLGASLEDIIRTRLFITDISRWAEFAKAHSEIMGDSPPACSMIEVKNLISKEILIEIEVDAVLL